MKRKELGIWLRVVVAAGAVLVAGGCATLLPLMGMRIADMNPEYASLYWPCLIGVWLSAAAVLYACWLVWQMAGDILADKAFRAENAARLKRVAQLALGDTALYAVGAAVLFALGALHPGIWLGLLAVQFVGVAIAVVAAVLSHIVARGASLQQENELTV